MYDRASCSASLTHVHPQHGVVTVHAGRRDAKNFWLIILIVKTVVHLLPSLTMCPVDASWCARVWRTLMPINTCMRAAKPATIARRTSKMAVAGMVRGD